MNKNIRSPSTEPHAGRRPYKMNKNIRSPSTEPHAGRRPYKMNKNIRSPSTEPHAGRRPYKMNKNKRSPSTEPHAGRRPYKMNKNIRSPSTEPHAGRRPYKMNRNSSVSIATRYELDGQGIETRWGVRLSAPVQTGPGAHSASYTMGTGSFPGVKRPGRGVDYPPSSRAEVQGRVGLSSRVEVKERVELYVCSPLDLRGLFWGDLYLYLS